MPKKSLKRNISKSQVKPKSKSAKISTSNTPDEELALSHFLILPLILNYLNPKDKIQLSEVNKPLRLQLEPFIFYKIKLFPDNYLDNRSQYGGNKNIRGIQSILLDQAIKFIGPKSYLVKETTIREEFNSKFAKKLFSTFSHIITVNLHNFNFDAPILIESLKALEQLEHLNVSGCHFHNSGNISDSKMYYRLPKTIKTFKFEESYDNDYLNHVEIIDNIYTNLQNITLINPNMFNQFQFQYPKLIELDISRYELSDIPLIEKILVNNPQVTKLSIPGNELTESFMNFILALKNLTFFKLNYDSLTTAEGWKLIDNSTINTIGIYNYECYNLLTLLLRFCKHLQTIQIYTNCYYIENINWKWYHGSLNTIEFNDCRGIPYNLKQFVNCLSLKKIVLRAKDDDWAEEILNGLNGLNGLNEFDGLNELNEFGELVKVNYLEGWKVEKGETIILTKLN